MSVRTPRMPAVLWLVLAATPAFAGRRVEFLAGAGIGFLAHEGGHWTAGAAFGADPHFKRIEVGGFPFVAIDYRKSLPPSHAYLVSSAGFAVQNVASEWILTKRPGLRYESGPLAKGVLAWSVVSSSVYAGAAFTKRGPAERDTRGMAASLGVDEAWVGAMLLAPAALDTYRYYRPNARWARWASRALKLGLVLAALK